jgi:hypothetical protein
MPLLCLKYDLYRLQNIHLTCRLKIYKFFETDVLVGSATLAPPMMWTWATLPWPVSTRIAVSSYGAFRRCVRGRRSMRNAAGCIWGPFKLDGIQNYLYSFTAVNNTEDILNVKHVVLTLNCNVSWVRRTIDGK